jgi:cell division protease FtsH
MKVGKKGLTKKMKMANDNYFQDLDIIRNSRELIHKDDYNMVIQDIKANDISKIYINNDYSEVVSVYNKVSSNYVDKYHIVETNPVLTSKIIDKATELNIPIYFDHFTPEYVLNIQGIITTIMKIFSLSIPLFILFSFLSVLSNMPQNAKPPMGRNRMTGGPQSNIFNPFNFIENKDVAPVNMNVTLASWAGSPEVIEECKEIISYLENKNAFKEIGAEMPKGILLEGPPGTGKTLLAKAIATETNSTFIAASGSEFVELFVGMGASRVRELFESARENRPCIIFIDEIDAVGRQRGMGGGIGGGTNEQEQTLNQILYEMDGFNNNEDIVVMAATNRKDILDSALLRPGRFDRIIRVPLPDTESRNKILEYYLNSKNKEPNISIHSISEITAGFSGAELKNLINEAAILSARNNITYIKQEYIFEAFEKLIVGIIKKNATMDSVTNRRVAIHETGHSLLALKYKDYFDFQKVSINPTYNGAGGYTIFTELPEISSGGLYTKDMLLKRLVIMLGGKAAESIYYGDDYVSTGAVQDLKEANQLAKKMIGNFGMGEQLKTSYNENVGDNAYGGVLRADYSDYIKYITDKEIKDMLEYAYDEAKHVLMENTNVFIEFSELLQKHKNLYKKDIESIQKDII